VQLLVPLAAVLSYALTLVALAIWPPLTALVLLVTWPFDRNRVVAGRFLRLCSSIILRSFPFWRMRVEGRWPGAGGPYVVVANHQSFLDVFLISGIIPHEMKWVAKKELFKIPWVGWQFFLAGDIPHDRGDLTSAVEVMNRARRYLDRGMSVMMFPEGTRSIDGKLLPFKAGAFKLAVDAGVPVLPIAVSGTAQGMPKGSPWVRPSELTLRILEPVPTAGLTDRDLRKLRDGVRSQIAGALGLPDEPVRRRARVS
jgi:1-acyl-sn-glycerol-3-phosphate acyltransferase